MNPPPNPNAYGMPSGNPAQYTSNPPNPDAYGKPSGNPAQYTSNAPVNWTTGLFGCCSDCPNCLITCCCPCITFGRIAEIVDRGQTSCCGSGALYALLALVTGCGYCYSCCYRTKMRKQYNLTASPCPDFCVHCCCESCALCQEYRELTNRGYDMSLGWEGNMARQNRGVAMAPNVVGGMNR